MLIKINTLAQIGKKRTILLSISILMVSLHTIYFYHSIRPEIDPDKLKQQIIRFILTIILLIFAYLCKNWARKLAVGLFSLAAIFAGLGLLKQDLPLTNKIPIIVMLIVHGISVKHFGFSKSYREYFDFKNQQ